ncbi:MAG TPA: hypothetical protein DF774_12045 [Rheinheimera sp.]|uniref:hypothetical protein n=1 Tax=Rheinheimera sp. TaxID=1869214 RepID=UPI000EF0B97C|nr:hypothetical protein [Rheinheimera sp.]HCU66477.1 hypothetical protein [Rheinheimera sp.]
MHKDCTALLQLYQYLDRYYQQSAKPQLSDKAVLLAEQLASEFCKLHQLQPRLMQSQLSLTVAGYSLTSQLALKQAVLLNQLGSAAKWPQSLCEELVAVVFYRLTGVHQLLQNNEHSTTELMFNAGLFSLKAAGNSFSYRHWRRLLRDSSLSSQQKALWQQTPYADAIRFCSLLSAQITPTQQQLVLGLDNALQRLLQQPYQAADLYFANLLASRGGELHLIGRFCSDGIGEVALISQTTPEHKAYVLDLASKKLKPEPSQLYDQGMKLLPPTRLPDNQWLELFIGQCAEPELVPVFSLAELQQLNPNQSVRQQVAWLQTQPQLATALCAQASLLTRQQLPVRDPAHAVALVGADNLPFLLKICWLEQQQSDCRQPYAHWFTQLQHCLAACFSLLAKASNELELSPLQAQLLAGSFCLVMMQEDHCRWYPLQQSNQTTPLALFSHQTSWQLNDFPRQVSQLVASLGFNRLWQDAVLCYREPLPMQGSYSQQQCANALIQLGWTLAESIFYPQTAPTAEQLLTQKSAVKALDLANLSMAQWQQQVLELHQCYWPLAPIL